jgi:hypothetical protein
LQDVFEAGDAGVGLGDRIGGDEAEAAAAPQEGEGAAQEVGGEVAVAVGAGVQGLQPISILGAEGAADAVAPKEGRVADDEVEAGVVAGEDLGEFEGPVEWVSDGCASVRVARNVRSSRRAAGSGRRVIGWRRWRACSRSAGRVGGEVGGDLGVGGEAEVGGDIGVRRLGARRGGSGGAEADEGVAVAEVGVKVASGRLGSPMCRHNARRASSTARGSRSTPWRQVTATSRRAGGEVGIAAGAGEVLREDVAGGDQERGAAHGGVADAEGEDRRRGWVGAEIVELGAQGVEDQVAGERGIGVVAAAAASLAAGAYVEAVVDALEAEGEQRLMDVAGGGGCEELLAAGEGGGGDGEVGEERVGGEEGAAMAGEEFVAVRPGGRASDRSRG